MHTTININREQFSKLKKISDIYNITTDKLISLLIEKVLSSNVLKVTSDQQIRYQKRDPEKNWHAMHVTFDQHIYEKGLDSRKFFKYSVSFVVSLGFVIFLGEIIKKLNKSYKDKEDHDNYQSNYIFIAKMYDSIQGFTILWGVPAEKHLKGLLPI